MSGLAPRVIDFYRTQGLLSLFRRGGQFAIDKLATLPILDGLAFWLSKRRLSHRMKSEENLDDVLDTAFQYTGYGRYRSIKPLQIRVEFEELVEEVVGSNPTTVMEIGTANGGTFYTWCRYLDSASTIISLDLPGGNFGGGYTRKKTHFFEEFSPNKELVFVRQDSHDERTLQRVREAVPDSGIDFLFIDGDHTYEGVKQDFEMYSPLVSEGGLIAFHDIVDGPEENVGGVPEFWRELKTERETEEIVANWDEQDGYGIGLIFVTEDTPLSCSSIEPAKVGEDI